MADIVNGIQINKLPEATSVSDEDILILENAERTQKVSVGTLRENVDTQGVNLVRFTKNLPVTGNLNTGIKGVNPERVEATEDGVKLIFSGRSNDCIQIPLHKVNAIKGGETITLSFEYRSTVTSFGSFYFMQSSGENVFTNNFPNLEISETDWKKYSYTFKAHDEADARNCGSVVLFYAHVGDDYVGKWIEIKKESLKLERGTVTNPIWTPAPEDIVVNNKESVVDALGYEPPENDTQGINLLTGTKEWSEFRFNSVFSDINSIQNGFHVLHIKSSTTNVDINRYNIKIEKLGDTYTFSFFAKGTRTVYAYFYGPDNDYIKISKVLTSDGHSSHSSPDGSAPFSLTNYWKKYWVQWTLYQTGDLSIPKTLMFRLTANSEAYIYAPKLEHGLVTDPVWTPAPEDLVVKSDLSPSLLNLIIPKNAGARNSNFRGADLGTQVMDSQYAAIDAGNFDDLFVGDFWTLNGTVYRIAGFDILLNTGDTQLTKHHAVIVPDKNMYSAKMNDENTTDGGYYNSVMKQSNLAQALTKVKTDFGADHIIKHRKLLTNAVNGDNPSGWAWYDTEIDLMTERQVYGSPAWGQAAHNGYDANAQYSRFPLFALAPEYITNRTWYWLQDVRSSAGFCRVYGNGGANYCSASDSGGVRPAFLIGNQI